MKKLSRFVDTAKKEKVLLNFPTEYHELFENIARREKVPKFAIYNTFIEKGMIIADHAEDSTNEFIDETRMCKKIHDMQVVLDKSQPYFFYTKPSDVRNNWNSMQRIVTGQENYRQYNIPAKMKEHFLDLEEKLNVPISFIVLKYMWDGMILFDMLKRTDKLPPVLENLQKEIITNIRLSGDYVYLDLAMIKMPDYSDEHKFLQDYFVSDN